MCRYMTVCALCSVFARAYTRGGQRLMVPNFHLNFCDWVSVNLELALSARLAGGQAPFCSQPLGLPTCTATLALKWAPGTKLRSLCLHGKHFALRAISPITSVHTLPPSMQLESPRHAKLVVRDAHDQERPLLKSGLKPPSVLLHAGCLESSLSAEFTAIFFSSHNHFKAGREDRKTKGT